MILKSSKRGDDWPALAIREGSWKLLLGKEPHQVELFRFPNDRLEQNNLRDRNADEVRRLNALIDAWKQTLPAKPKASCLSGARVKRGERSKTK